MAEPLLQLLDAVRETTSRAPASPDPIRDTFLPSIRKATSLDDSEALLHAATTNLQWLSSKLAQDLSVSRSGLREHFDRTASLLLDYQDQLRDSVAKEAGEAPAQQTLLAQETFRRFLVEGRPQHAPVPGDAKTSMSGVAQPTLEYLLAVALRLALLVLAIEHLASQKRRELLLRGLANKAFETSQTLRGLVQELNFDLTPWLDVPATRARRIAESASSFWNSFTPEDQKAVAEAWAEPVDLSAKWE